MPLAHASLIFGFMRNTFTYPPLDSPDSKVNPAFNVVTVYEDFETGQNARKTYDFLAEHLGNEFRLNNQMWKFDVLAMPKLKEMAASDAAAADIILVAMRGTNDLPTEVREWMKLWLAHGTRAIAMVALFEVSNQPVGDLIRDYLADVARRADVEFFSQPGIWPAPAPSEDPLVSGTRQWGEKEFSRLAGAVRRDHSVLHWGINE